MTTRLPLIERRASANAAEVAKHNKGRRTSVGYGERKENVSPFSLPTDDEIFVYRELERKKREDVKHIAQNQKIWDKKTGTSRRPLRLFREAEVAVKENIRSNAKPGQGPGYSWKEKAMIVEAQKIMNERRKSREANGKDQREGVVELLAQKKEMFLVEMTAGVVEKERENLIKRAGEKDDALKKSDEMLEKDWREFEAYKQNNKQETDFAIQRHNNELDARKRTETEHKMKNNDLINMKAEKSKNEELIQKYINARAFLNRLTPKEFLDQRRKEVDRKVEEFRAEWLDREHQFYREDSQSFMSESLIKGAGKDKKPIIRKTTFKPDTEKIFAEKLERGEFEAIEEFKWGQKMYFTDPGQLVEVYMRLEENNLLLIQSMQDTEQNLDTLRNVLKVKKAEFDKKIGGLRENKMQLERNKAEKEEKIQTLKIQSQEPTLSNNFDRLAFFRKKIMEVVSLFKEDNKTNVDQESLSTIELLASLEHNLEKQLAKIRTYKPARVAEQKRECEDIRKRANRKLQVEAEQKLADDRSKKASERALEKSKKRKGRVDMIKSTPLEKKEVVAQVVQPSAEEEDMKYFKPYMSKF